MLKLVTAINGNLKVSIRYLYIHAWELQYICIYIHGILKGICSAANSNLEVCRALHSTNNNSKVVLHTNINAITLEDS